MDQRLIGLTDRPISETSDEALGLIEHAAALTQFVRHCQTPMTIALQGDWGSGKTSLMNLVARGLAEDVGARRVTTVAFNTWQYSQFEMADTLAASLMSQLVRSLASKGDQTARDSAAKTLRSILKVGTRITLAALNRTQVMDAIEKSAKDLAEGRATEPSELDKAEDLRQLRAGLTDVVRLTVGNGAGHRLVVFVDDLDRLVPSRAVELLECLKLFLDLEGCVFVLACDYEVIRQGLKQRFGVDEGQLGRSFFDKIIQVPFQMPVSQYQVHEYLRRLLQNIGVEYEEADVALYERLVRTSVGFNPRDMKRLFNTLYLLGLVASEKRLFESSGVPTSPNEQMRVLFAILCLQREFEPVYSYLQEQDQVTDEHLRDLSELSPEVNPEASKDKSRGALAERRLVEALMRDGGESALERLGGFLAVFRDAVQLRSDQQENAAQHLSEDEARLLKRLLAFSAVVSTGAAPARAHGEERNENRSMGRGLAERVNGELRTLLGELSMSEDPLHSYQGRTSEDVILWADLVVGGRPCRVHFDFRADGHDAWLKGKGRGLGGAYATDYLRSAWTDHGAVDATLRRLAREFPRADPRPDRYPKWILLERGDCAENAERRSREDNFRQLVESVMRRLLSSCRDESSGTAMVAP